MVAFRRQFVLTSVAIAAAMILGGASARAGYVSVPAMAEHEGGNSLAQTPVSALGENETTTSQPRPDADDSRVPSDPGFPTRKLPQVAWDFGHNNGAGTSSSSGPSSGPSASAAGDLPRPQVPPLELSSLLPPQKGDAHPFSVASFLFRPPRIGA